MPRIPILLEPPEDEKITTTTLYNEYNKQNLYRIAGDRDTQYCNRVPKFGEGNAKHWLLFRYAIEDFIAATRIKIKPHEDHTPIAEIWEQHLYGDALEEWRSDMNELPDSKLENAIEEEDDKKSRWDEVQEKFRFEEEIEINKKYGITKKEVDFFTKQSARTNIHIT